MFRTVRPDQEEITAFLAQQSHLDFTYSAVGATGELPPSGYKVDHTRVCLGNGQATFEVACDAIRNWRQFDLGWMTAQPESTTLRVGNEIAIVAKSVGLWWLNACRIVYLIESENGGAKFGMAYGTLPSHAGKGEERFLIELDNDGQVWYDILAFSRPNGWLSYLGYPHMRLMQKRFGRDSARNVRKVVQEKLASK